MQSPDSAPNPISHHDSPPRILIVDDRVADARELGNTMVSRGFELEVVHNAFKALDIAKRWKPRVAILDVNMPGMNGLVLSQRLKDCADDPIVIFVTSDDSNEMRRLCLESGDDYITKPYDGENLLLRVQSKLRRYDTDHKGAPGGSEDTSLVSPVTGPSTQPDERTVAFTPTESRLLSALIAEQGRTASRDKLLGAVWGDASAVNDNTLDINIRRLRKKIEPDPTHPRIIITVRREGFRLDLAELRRSR